MDNLQLIPINRQEPIEALISTDKPFIEANTIQSSLEEIKTKHIIPVYSKTNECLISIAEFIQACNTVVNDVFLGEEILQPNIRVSHPIQGRVPSAKHKSANELQEWEKTLYYERACFVIEIPSIQSTVDNNILSLTVGGVKSYNLDRMHSKKDALESFSFFIGFQNRVCSNNCIWTDGYSDVVYVKSLTQLSSLMYGLFQNYNTNYHLHHLENLVKYELTERQFAQIIGKCRMYPNLPNSLKKDIPPLLFGENQISLVVKNYYKDSSFCRNDNGNISLWKLYNLLTGSNKNSYIDLFLARSVNAFNFVEQIMYHLQNQKPSWFLT